MSASHSLGNRGEKEKIRTGRHSFATRLTKLRRKRKGKKGYETKGENRAVGRRVRLYFALASRGADSSFAFVFSAAQLHLGARGTGPSGFRSLPCRVKSVRETGDGFTRAFRLRQR